mgnify:CR=1 FL=1
MAQGLIDPGQHISDHFVAVGFVEQFVPRLRVDLQLQVLAAGRAQRFGQICQTLAFAHRITFTANHQQRFNEGRCEVENQFSRAVTRMFNFQVRFIPTPRFTWDAAQQQWNGMTGDEATRVKNAIVLNYPVAPDDQGIHPIALTAYNNTGPAYPFTC